jgi:hypothetical protein
MAIARRFAIGALADVAPEKYGSPRRDPASIVRRSGGWMIVLMHVATGALAGAAVRSRVRAAALGAPLHFVFDVIPHEDIPSRRFETASGVAAVLLLARRRGIDAATVGAVVASAPDLEHILPLPRPGGRALFPSHRFARPTRVRGVPAWVQLCVAIPAIARLVSHRDRLARLR